MESTSTKVEPTSPEEISLFDPDVQENPFPTYKYLRDEQRFFEDPAQNAMVLTRFEDLSLVLRKSNVFTRGSMPPSDDPDPVRSPLRPGEPDHRHYRDLADPFFQVATVTENRPMLEEVANKLVDKWIDAGEVEFVSGYAIPFPVEMITRYIGLPVADIEQLKIWSEACVLQFAYTATPEEQAEANRQVQDFHAYMREMLAEKRGEPDEWVLSGLAHGTLPGGRPLTDGEIIGYAVHLYFGGNETTTFALTSGLWLLLSNPDIYERLQNDRSLVPNFVEEVLRLESPTQGLPRVAGSDTEISGCPVKQGQMIHLRYAAANRDERMFADPDVLDVDRKNAYRHVAFSLGASHCPGAGLSRVEQRVTYDVLLDRLRDMAFVPGKNDFSHHPNFTLRAMKELHVQFKRA